MSLLRFLTMMFIALVAAAMANLFLAGAVGPSLIVMILGFDDIAQKLSEIRADLKRKS